MTRETEIIARLRRFATTPEARGLLDDAALLDGLVITHDSIAEGVHFLPFDPPASVGWKLVAVNLSDLAAKGATPAGALLSLVLSDDADWDDQFLTGVEHACESYGLPLIGGDTIALPRGAPRMLGLTAIGRAGSNVPDRSGAAPGDLLWVAGTVGDAGAGLKQLLGNPKASGPLVEAYRRPVPLLADGRILAPIAHAMMDISDGLLLDARRMADASNCTFSLELGDVELSEAYCEAEGKSLSACLTAVTSGDDYALLIALPPEIDPSTFSLPSGTTIRRIGTVAAGPAAIRLMFEGRPVELPETLGYEHRGTSASAMADRD